MSEAHVGAGPDIYNGGLHIWTHPTPDGTYWTDAEVDREIFSIIGADVSTRIHRAPLTTASGTRVSDSNPYTMGARANRLSGGYCSLGIPLVLNGVHMVLTAGHCRDSGFTNNGSMGSMYTTSYPGNALNYGEWTLIYGKDYRRQLYSGAMSSSAVLPITAADWGIRAPGLGVCSSGSTTGSICRYRVAINDQSDWLKNPFTGQIVLSGHMTITNHDPSWNLTFDNGGWQGGDSGGSIYYSNGAGMTVVGIITSVQTPSPYNYWYTELRAVHFWNSSISFGGY